MPTAAGSLTRAMLPCVARRLVRVAGCASRDRRCSWAAALPLASARHLAATRCTASDGAVAGAGSTAPSPPGGRAVGSATPEKQGQQQLVDTQPVRGTRDFPPDDMRLRNWLFSHFREVSSLFGFEEWDAPVVESEELYTRKAGEEITQQLYNFEDKGGRRLALRPELTPSLARIVLAKGKGLPLPAKWFAVGQCWRYERMTRGRRREHYQWNMDIVGVEGIAAEAELLAAITTFFARVGLTPADVGIRVSSRKVLAALLAKAGVPEGSFAAVCVCVDKLEKVPRDQVQADLDALGVPPAVCDALLAAMALKSLDELETLLGSDAEAVRDMRALWGLAQAYGYADWLVFDATVVRGLSYYTGVVFEAFDRAASLRAICGGGRYDRLLSAYGGADVPCCGFGFGDAVIVELLADRKLLPTDSTLTSVDDVIAPLDEACRGPAVALAAALRRRGRRVDVLVEPPRKPKTLAKRATNVGASTLYVVGGQSWEEGRKVRVKTLATFDETDVPLDDLLSGGAP